MPSLKHRLGGDEQPAGPWVRLVPVVGVAALMTLSLVAKLINRFAFFIYPDSYYYLMIAENLRVSGSPFGTLGPGGQPFPPEGYAALKSTYPALVALVTMLGVGSEAAGHIVTTLAALAAVPMAYVATRRLIGDRRAGLAAAALVATSYSLTYWSGFVMTDSVSVLLALALLAMVARVRPDDWSNGGDLGTGLVLALLLLSRPAYIVVLPPVLWLGFGSFGWTRRRAITAAAAAALPVSLAALLWFPPPEFAAQLLGNLLPVLGTALVVGVGVPFLLRALGRRPSAERGSAGAWWGVALAAVLPVAFALDGIIALVAGEHPLLAVHRFVLRDPAIAIALVAGAFALRKGSARDVGVPLLVAGLTILGVYVWADAADSRYLVHLLPFLVPVAASAVLLVPIRTVATPPRSRVVVSVVLALALIAAVYQGGRGFVRASVAEIDTDYLHAVATGVESSVRADDVLITAVPWPYYYRLRIPTWAASVVFADAYHDYVSADATVVVLADDALWLHYPELAGWLEEGAEDRLVREFDVSAVYGYRDAAASSGKPIRLYRMTASGLGELVPAGYEWVPPVATQ
ncbi:MAG: glycosyltransferase family 39 protein [Coriobacteriia bacterium]